MATKASYGYALSSIHVLVSSWKYIYKYVPCKFSTYWSYHFHLDCTLAYFILAAAEMNPLVFTGYKSYTVFHDRQRNISCNLFKRVSISCTGLWHLSNIQGLLSIYFKLMEKLFHVEFLYLIFKISDFSLFFFYQYKGESQWVTKVNRSILCGIVKNSCESKMTCNAQCTGHNIALKQKFIPQPKDQNN